MAFDKSGPHQVFHAARGRDSPTAEKVEHGVDRIMIRDDPLCKPFGAKIFVNS